MKKNLKQAAQNKSLLAVENLTQANESFLTSFGDGENALLTIAADLLGLKAGVRENSTK